MTRGSIPRFDLYEELEVSRQASGEVIEAAYRALVKRHHPDVATPADRERIKRLNVAREWLVSPTKRARYDAAATWAGRSTGAVDREAATPAGAGTRQWSRADGPASGPASGSGPRSAERGSSGRTSSPASFGVNSREVRHFLAELRELDEGRAARLVEARDALDATAYADARRAALSAGRRAREAEWLFARDAAAVIAKGKLAFSPLSPVVSAVVADVAGAIVARDLISTADLDLLLEPWRRSAPAAPTIGAREGAAARLAPRPVTLPVVAGLAARTFRGRGERLPLGLGIVASGVLLFVAASALGLGPRRPESAVAGLTSPPSPGSVAVVATPGGESPSGPAGSITPTPSGVEAPSGAPIDSGPPLATPAGLPTPRPTQLARPTGTPFVPALPTPPLQASPSPGPSEAPTSPPTPTPPPTSPPTPTPPPPTATPPVECTVVDLVGVNTSNAQLAWSTAGFTGTVLFSPPIPPQYKIAWQSLAPGSVVACSSDIAVAAAAP